MTTKIITSEELLIGIRAALFEDKKAFDLYDPYVSISSLEEMVSDIARKINTFKSAILVGVHENDEIVGYFAYQGRILISFSLAMKYRVRKYLRLFFNIINKELKKDFVCYLYKKNIRAIKWFHKHGMESFDFTEDIVKLVCPKHEFNYN